MVEKLPVEISQELLEKVILIAREAGQAILEVYRQGEFGVQQKADDSPVTRADLAAHKIIYPALQTLLDDTPVLCEEAEIPDFAVRRCWQQYWLVDPLDGTKEFINRNGEFTVNIALIHQHKPVLGVVHVPVKSLTYVGVAGKGAFKYSAAGKQKITARSMTDRACRALPVAVVASRRHGSEAVTALLKKIGGDLGAMETKNMGSSLKLCLVAEGAADLYPRLALTSEWDTAAAQAIVEAAGGLVLDPQMRELRYNAKDELLNPHFFVIGDPDFDWREFLLES